MFGVVAIAASVAALTLCRRRRRRREGPLLRDCRDGEKSEAVNFSSLVCRVAQAACKWYDYGERGGRGIFVGSTGF